MNTKKVVDVLLVGVGGYGNFYVNALLEKGRQTNARIAGVVDPKPEGCNKLDELKESGVPFYNSMDVFYRENGADLAVISAPVHYHKEYTCSALEHGSNVLCEKPAASSVQYVEEMIAARDRTEHFVAIGYQWSFSEAIQELKKDIMKGMLGRPKRLKTLVLWPRDFAYYNRNDWAGKKTDPNGRPVLDSVAHNATSHFLHNMFYVLGSRVDRSAMPVSVRAELYRANDIENYDTVASRIKTDNDVDILFIATHASENFKGPIFEYEFENATVKYENDGKIIAIFPNTETKNYGDPFAGQDKKLWDCVEAVKDPRETILCGPEAAMSEVKCIAMIQDSADIHNFPEGHIREKEDEEGVKSLYVQSLDEDLERCYENWSLPAEENIESDYLIRWEMS